MVKRAILAVVIASMVAVPAVADMTVNVANVPGGYNNGGPFTATVNGSAAIGIYAPGSSFYTFCLEGGITYSPGTTYLATVDAGAISGGGGLNPDPISDQSAWLYNNFLDGTLTYLDGYTALQERSAVQEAIWRFEDEASHTTVETLALDLMAQANAAVTGGYTNTNIMAMNLWSGSAYTGTDIQSMMVRVPVPGAVLLGVLGLGVASARLRRRSAK